ncbi:MAG: glycosyltransferase [Burkholderiaceae bacterium]
MRFQPGGAQARFLRLARAFPSQSLHLVSAMDDSYAAMDLLADLPNIRACPVETAPRSMRRNVSAMVATIRRERPSLVASYNWGAIEWALACALTRTRHVHVEDGFGPDEADRRHLRRNLGRRALLALSSGELVVCSSNLERIARHEWGIPARRIHYIPNGVDISAIRLRSTRTARSIFARDDGEIVLGTLAMLRPEKNLGAMLRIVADVEHVRLVIAGDGPERESLEQTARALGIDDRVEFLGRRDDIATLLAELDVFALTSRTEQLPMALLEAMAAGLPAVATDVGDVAAALAPANRSYIVAQEPDALAAATRALVADPALRESIGRANRARVESHYSQHEMVRAWSEILQLEPIAPT